MSESINTPGIKLTSNYIPAQNSYGDCAFQGEYTGANLIYAGLARPGVQTSAAKWQLKKLTYSGANLVSITWPLNANNVPSSEYEFIYDNRATYTFV